jgi:hypothetical protein
MARTLVVTDCFNDLDSLLHLVASSPSPCPCSDGIFSCPPTEPIFRFLINAYYRVERLDVVVVAFETEKNDRREAQCNDV